MKALERQWRSPAARIVIAWMMLLSISVVAQDDERRPGRFLSPGRGFGPGVDIVGVQPLDISTPVVGIPFSAVSVTEIAQQFADGNRVDQIPRCEGDRSGDDQQEHHHAPELIDEDTYRTPRRHGRKRVESEAREP